MPVEPARALEGAGGNTQSKGARVFAGYTDITFFNRADRYKVKPK